MDQNVDSQLADQLAKGKADRRKHLLARMAGNIAAGIAAHAIENDEPPDSVAVASVDIAERILQRIGL